MVKVVSQHTRLMVVSCHVVEEGAPHCYVAVDEKRSLVYGAMKRRT